MSAIFNYLASLPEEMEEIDLSTFELIEEIDDGSWIKLKSNETMKRLKLPPSLLTVRVHAFIRCSQITNVTIPSSLRSIKYRAFFQCRGLAMNNLKLPDSLEELGYGAFQHCEGLTGKLSTHLAGEYSFYGCTGLTELDLENCKEIKFRCFDSCTALIGPLMLPSSLQSISCQAFCKCTGLTGPLIIPPFVSFIHPRAFYMCSVMFQKIVKEAIEEHFPRYESWKARGNVLMTLIRFDGEYRRAVEENGSSLNSAASNSFLSGISKEAQLIYKAAGHVDGADYMANGICRLIISFLPMDRKYYGTQLSNEEIDSLNEEE
jgi:hypothetical protein